MYLYYRDDAASKDKEKLQHDIKAKYDYLSKKIVLLTSITIPLFYNA